MTPTTPSPISEQAAGFDMLAHLARQRAWSEMTFGPGARTKGVVDHIRKELLEIEGDPTDLTEWIDVVILALDGAWRAGGSPEQIIATMVAKQTKNEGRVWPDWRTADPDKAIEHDRSGDTAPTTGSANCGTPHIKGPWAHEAGLITCARSKANPSGIVARVEKIDSDCFTDAEIAVGRVLAAAPDLLEALFSARDHLRETLSDPRIHPIGHCPTLDIIEAVIAKATGAYIAHAVPTMQPSHYEEPADCDHNYVEGECRKCGCIHPGE